METPAEPKLPTEAKHYYYEQLSTDNQPNDRIRVLVLEPDAGTEPLKAKLIIASLVDSPRYYALS